MREYICDPCGRVNAAIPETIPDDHAARCRRIAELLVQLVALIDAVEQKHEGA